MDQKGLSMLKSHTNHIVDAFIGLIQKYRIIHPMIFEKKVFDKHRKAGKAWGHLLSGTSGMDPVTESTAFLVPYSDSARTVSGTQLRNAPDG
jgi:hypothetical protein